jgi:hypothetical protein
MEIRLQSHPLASEHRPWVTNSGGKDQLQKRKSVLHIDLKRRGKPYTYVIYSYSLCAWNTQKMNVAHEQRICNHQVDGALKLNGIQTINILMWGKFKYFMDLKFCKSYPDIYKTSILYTFNKTSLNTQQVTNMARTKHFQRF